METTESTWGGGVMSEKCPNRGAAQRRPGCIWFPYGSRDGSGWAEHDAKRTDSCYEREIATLKAKLGRCYNLAQEIIHGQAEKALRQAGLLRPVVMAINLLPVLEEFLEGE